MPSDVHPGESVRVCIRRDLASRPGCRLNGPYLVDLHIGSSYRLAKNYAGRVVAQPMRSRYDIRYNALIFEWNESAHMAIFRKIFDLLGAKPRPNSPLEARSLAFTSMESPAPTETLSEPRRLPTEFDDRIRLGRTTHSNEKMWSVGFWDPGPDGSHEKRTISLRDNTTGKIVSTLENVERPFSADVSDIGVFAVQDAGLASELSSKVLAFDKFGKLLYERAYKANLLGFSISPCGGFLASQTCNSGNEDSCIFEIHDIAQQRVLASRRPATEWCFEYEFDSEDGELKHVFAKLPKLGKFAYSPTGEFLDAKKYLSARLKKGDVHARIRAAEELVETDGSEKSLQRAFDVVDAAIKELPQDAGWLAGAYRIKGEISEKMGLTTAAIEAYRIALGHNPKVGVKKRLTALEKAAVQESLLATQAVQSAAVPLSTAKSGSQEKD